MLSAFPAKKIILLQANPDLANLLTGELRKDGFNGSICLAGNESDLRNQLDREAPQVILAADAGLDVLRVQRALAERSLDLPMIVIGGQADEARAAECLRQGVAEYLYEYQLPRLGVIIERVLERKPGAAGAPDQSSAALVGEMLVHSPNAGNQNAAHRILDKVFASLDEVIIVQDLDTRIILECSDAVRRVLGYEPEEVIGRTPEKFFTSKEAFLAFGAAMQAALDSTGIYNCEQWYKRKDGKVICADITITEIRGEDHQRIAVVGALRDITGRKQAEQEMQRRITELQTLQSVALAGAEVTSLDELVERVSQIVGERLYPDSFGIALIDQERSVMNCYLTSHLQEEGPSFPIRLNQGITGRAARTGKPCIVPDVQQDPDYVQRYPSVQSELCVPINDGNRVIGVIDVESKHLDAFDESDEEYLVTVASELGNAIEKVHLQEQTQRQLRRLTALRTIDEAILSSPNLNHTLDVLKDQITSQLQVDGADFLLYDPATETLRLPQDRSLFSSLKRPVILKLGEEFSGMVALERKMKFIPDLSVVRNGLTANIEEVGENFTSFLAMPLVAKDELKGVLELFSRAPMDPNPDWMSFLKALAGQAAIAIDNALLFHEQQTTNDRLVQAYDATLEGWSHALDMRDKETEGHCFRVTELTLKLARMFSIPEAELPHVRRGAQLHDIGKMAIPDSILLKNGPLTEEEWAIMRQHPLYALDMLYPIEFLQPALDIPYCHHEKWDGTGYPQGLKGEEIPLVARIFAVVDVWDALTSLRPYRPAWSASQALKHICEQSGTHFDPQVVEQFMTLIGESMVTQRAATRDHQFIMMDN